MRGAPGIVKSAASFFKRVANIIYPIGLADDIGVAEGQRIYLDADQGAPNSYFVINGAFLELWVDGVERFRFGGGVYTTQSFFPVNDGANIIGAHAARFASVSVSNRLAISDGTNDTESISSGEIMLNEHAGIISQTDTSLLCGIAGSISLKIPMMNTAQRNALTAASGNIIYDITVNELQAYVNGAWVKISTEAPSD